MNLVVRRKRPRTTEKVVPQVVNARRVTPYSGALPPAPYQTWTAYTCQMLVRDIVTYQNNTGRTVNLTELIRRLMDEFPGEDVLVLASVDQEASPQMLRAFERLVNEAIEQ